MNKKKAAVLGVFCIVAAAAVVFAKKKLSE